MGALALIYTFLECERLISCKSVMICSDRSKLLVFEAFFDGPQIHFRNRLSRPHRPKVSDSVAQTSSQTRMTVDVERAACQNCL
jgi:hypothetical protein